MTISFLDISDEIKILKCLTYNLATKNYKIYTEKLETWGKVKFSCLPESTNFAFLESLFKNPSPTKIESMYQTIWTTQTSLTIWINQIEKTLNRLGDNKTHLRSDISCKWTPLSLQGEHFVTQNFWIPEGSPLQVRLQIVENLLAIILIPKKVQTEELPNLLLTLKISRGWIKAKS